MEPELEENLTIDIDLDIEYIIYKGLEHTISTAIDEELKKDGEHPIIPKQVILSNFLAHNIDQIDENCHITQGPADKIYLCGRWLIRPVLYNGNMVPMMDFLLDMLAKEHISTENLIFMPEKTGIEIRKELWPESNKDNSSYDIPKSNRNSFGEKNMMPARGGQPPIGGIPPFTTPQGGPPPSAIPGMMPPGAMPPGAMPPGSAAGGPGHNMPPGPPPHLQV